MVHVPKDQADDVDMEKKMMKITKKHSSYLHCKSLTGLRNSQLRRKVEALFKERNHLKAALILSSRVLLKV